MSIKIVINSLSSGAYGTRTINGRQHLVTSMMAIEGDSVMNRAFYPLAAVQASYKQLNGLPAPAAHPRVDGVLTMAGGALATNAHNIGAFVLAPRMSGAQVICELAVDIELAGRDPRGVDLMNRVKTGMRVAVSTGMRGTLMQGPGEHNGVPFLATVGGIVFDHVAILLDEEPAGENTYTFNAAEPDDNAVLICNLADTVNDLRENLRAAIMARFGNEYGYVCDIIINPPGVLIERDDDSLEIMAFDYDENGGIVFNTPAVQVERNVTYTPLNDLTNANEGHTVDKAKLILAIIANKATAFTAADHAHLDAMDEAVLINTLAESMTVALTPTPLTPDELSALVTNAGDTIVKAADAEGLTAYLANRDGFEAYQKAAKDARAATEATIVANSKMTAEDLATMSDEAVERISNSLTPAQDYSPQGQKGTNGGGNAGKGVDYTSD